jgi:hypothetical protein
LWDAVTGKKLLSFKGHKSWLCCAAFSPEGQRIVTASAETAKVWDASTGVSLATLIGHSDLVMTASFSPDGQRIVTCSRDQTVRVWDAASGKELLTLKGRHGWVFSAAFSPDGKRIVAGNWDGTATVWEAASAEQVASWQKEEQALAASALNLEREREVAAVAEAQRTRAMRAQMPGGIKRWLVLLPIDFEGLDGAQTLLSQQLPQESQLRPRAGERIRVGQSTQVWREVQSEDPMIDFNQLAGAVKEWSVAYAVSYLQSETAQSAVLKIGSDDQARAYLNGKLVYEFTNARMYSRTEDTVHNVELKAGLNVLVLKVVNQTRDWQASVRLTDAAGQAIKGIQVGLTPP